MFEETGKLVVKLTNEVHRLRNERNALQSSIDSITAENLGLKKALKEKEEESSSEVALRESKLVDLRTLAEKLAEKCEKYKIICDLHVMERRDQEQTIQQLREEIEKKTEQTIVESNRIENKVAEVVKERDSAVAHSAKLKKYIMSLETEIKSAHARSVEDTAKLNASYEQIAILKEEISMQKLLTYSVGKADTDRLADTHGLISSREKFEEMKEDLKRATTFLRSTMEKYNQ